MLSSCEVKFPGKSVLSYIVLLPFRDCSSIGLSGLTNLAATTGTAAIIVLLRIQRDARGYRSRGRLCSIDPSIEEASTNLGADTSYTFRRITMPLVRPALIAGLSYSFVRSMTAVSAVIFLVSARWNHLTSLIYAQTEIMRLGAASVLSLFLIIIVIVIFGLMRAFLGEPVTRIRVGS